MTNTPRTWKGDFEKRQSVREKDSFLDYGDDDCPPEINWDRLKAFISTIEDEAVRRERARMLENVVKDFDRLNSDWKAKVEWIGSELQRYRDEYCTDLLNNN